MTCVKNFCLGILFAVSVPNAHAGEIMVSQRAPEFIARTHTGQTFRMVDRRGKWTVLYFFEKAESPGCTQQACAFRDNIKKIREQGADVFGVSADTVPALAAFHKKHDLNFTLLADPDLKVIDSFGARMEANTKVSRRWTFIIDPSLTIRAVDRDVDPAFDSQRVADALAILKTEPAKKVK